ncbi:hypothetical protein [Subtercola sp. YIM 133946]|uniref:hypothetical protein n=1 Tax=Subtercola sp. YIM 133946 TaxID=3118909 RepID=UPI002F925950
MLEAGVSPARAWAYISEGEGSERLEPDAPVDGDAGTATRAGGVRRQGYSVALAVAGVAERGASIDRAIATAALACDPRTRQAWNTVAAAWLVAAESGAPLAVCLRDLSRALLELGDVQRSVDVARAAPAATSKLMTLLPLVGLGFGALLGFNTLATLFTTPAGLVCLVAGLLLLLASARWSALLVRSSLPRTAAAGLAVELMAIAMSGGCSVSRAREISSHALSTYGLATRGDDRRVDAVTELARRAGVPAAELLRAEGAQARREALTHAQKRAAALSIRLMLPLAFCVLPAFMLLGVAPLLLSVVTSTFSSL